MLLSCPSYLLLLLPSLFAAAFMDAWRVLSWILPHIHTLSLLLVFVCAIVRIDALVVCFMFCLRQPIGLYLCPIVSTSRKCSVSCAYYLSKASCLIFPLKFNPHSLILPNIFVSADALVVATMGTRTLSFGKYKCYVDVPPTLYVLVPSGACSLFASSK